MTAIGLAAFVTILFMLLLRPVATGVGLIDRPGGRKTHHGEVPIIGGIAMFAGTVFGLSVIHTSLGQPHVFLMASALLVCTGSVDDRFGLSPYVRLVAQACAGLMMIHGAGLMISSLGPIFGSMSFKLDWGATVFTLLATAAAINAYNMMDGLDGLAGGLAVVGLGTLALGVMLSGKGELAIPVLVIIAAVSGFLVFNIPLTFNRLLLSFMGDAGSTFLGFSVAWFGVEFSQGEMAPVKPILVLWSSAIPLMELFTSSIRRLAARRSPLSADAEHFHHVLVRAGLSVRATFAILVGAGVLMSGMGLALLVAGVPDYVSFRVFLVVAVSISVALLRAERLAPLLPGMLFREPRVVTREDSSAV